MLFRDPFDNLGLVWGCLGDLFKDWKLFLEKLGHLLDYLSVPLFDVFQEHVLYFLSSVHAVIDVSPLFGRESDGRSWG